MTDTNFARQTKHTDGRQSERRQRQTGRLEEIVRERKARSILDALGCCPQTFVAAGFQHRACNFCDIGGRLLAADVPKSRADRPKTLQWSQSCPSRNANLPRRIPPKAPARAASPCPMAVAWCPPPAPRSLGRPA